MKTAKQKIAFVLAMLMVVAMAGCGKGKDKEKETKQIIADDKSVMNMTFTPPAAYESVLRTIEKTTAGDVIQKELDYTLADESEIDYAYLYMEGVDLAERLKSDETETKEIEGRTFYIRQSGDNYEAYAQKDAHIYGISYTPPAEGTRDPFDTVMDAIHFSEKMETVTDDAAFEGLSYTVDEELPLYSTTTTVTEKQDGTLLKKLVQWNYGKDGDNLDFRFYVCLLKNTTLENELDSEKEYEEKNVGDITYKVLKPDEGKAAYAYYTQHGDDVYEIRNRGVSNGWFGVSRSEESEAAFEKFLNSVHFA